MTHTLPPSRRAALKYAASALTIGPTLLTQGCAHRTHRHRVAIIGAGLSGLNAAMELEEKGIDYVVLEASNRVGGRVYTRDDLDHRPEAGGTSVGQSYQRFWQRCEQFGIELVPQGQLKSGWSLNIGGEMIRPDEWEGSSLNKTVGRERAISPMALEGWYRRQLGGFADVESWQTTEAHPFDVPLSDLYTNKGASAEALRLMEVNASVPNFDEASGVGAMRRTTLLQSLSERWRMRAYTVKGGSSRLPEAMAASLNQPVRFGEQVVAIDQTSAPVKLVTSTGTTYQCDDVICTIPFTAAQSIRFTPDLPAPMAAAIMDAKFVKTSLVHIQPKRRFWEDAGFAPSMWTDGAIGRLFKRWDDPAVKDHDALTLWVTGDACTPFDQMDAPDRHRFVKEQPAQLRPASEGQIDIIGENLWGKSPLAGGAYHLFGPGQIKQFAGELRKPVGKLHFAGEQTALVMVGMEAALESGERAAKAVASVGGASSL